MLTGFELTPAAPLDEREQRVCRQGRDDRYAWPSDSRVIEVAASLGTARAHATRDCACSESAAQQTWRAVRSRTSRRAGTERATTASALAAARASLCLCHASDHAVFAALTIAFGTRSLRCPASATPTGVLHRAFVAAGVARPLDGESSHELAVEFAAQVVRKRQPLAGLLTGST